MTPELHRSLLKKYENPVSYFVDYDIMQERNKSEDLWIADRADIKTEFMGLVSTISCAGDLAYEIANNIHNNEDKMVALGLLDKLCEHLSSACQPKEK